MDLFVVPTIGFDLLYAFVIVRLDRRDLVWINVTSGIGREHGTEAMHEYTQLKSVTVGMERFKSRVDI
jgi:hypothetical protein